jgi:hypothetical protein
VKTHGGVASALDGGEWSVLRPGHFTPGEEPLVPFGEEAGWAPEPACSRKKNLLPLPRVEPRVSSPWAVAITTELSRILYARADGNKM